MDGCTVDQGFVIAVQVLVEIAVSLVLCLWAALVVPGNFLRVLPDSDDSR